MTMKQTPAEVIDGLVASMAMNHLTPDAIGAIAAAAAVKQVVLTHYVPAFED